MELANDRTNEENTHLFKKVGSNFQIKDRTILFEPRGAWKTLLDSEFGGGNALVSRLRRDPALSASSDSEFWRKGRDSNSRYRYRYAAFRERCLQPLGHLSLLNQTFC